MAETIIFTGYGNSKVQADSIARQIQDASVSVECTHGETAVDASRHPGRVLKEVSGGGRLTLIGYSKGNQECFNALSTVNFRADEIDLEEMYLIAPPVETSPHHLAARAAKIAMNLIADSAHDPAERRSNQLHGRYLLGEVSWRAFHHANAIRQVARFDTINRYIEVVDRLQVPIVLGIMTNDELFPYEDKQLYRAESAGMRVVEIPGRHPHFVKYPVETLRAAGHSALTLAT